MGFHVNPDALFPFGKIIRDKAINLNNALVHATNTLEEMHKTWDGNRWNTLQEQWNNLIGTFNNMDAYLVEDIPTKIERISEGYANADTRSVGTPMSAAAQGIAKLTVGSNVINLSDENATTENQLKEVLESDFDEIVKYLNDIEQSFNDTIPHWTSPAATSNREAFFEDKATILNTIQNIRDNITTWIQESMKEYKTLDDTIKK